MGVYPKALECPDKTFFWQICFAACLLKIDVAASLKSFDVRIPNFSVNVIVIKLGGKKWSFHYVFFFHTLNLLILRTKTFHRVQKRDIIGTSRKKKCKNKTDLSSAKSKKKKLFNQWETYICISGESVEESLGIWELEQSEYCSDCMQYILWTSNFLGIKK